MGRLLVILGIGAALGAGGCGEPFATAAAGTGGAGGGGGAVATVASSSGTSSTASSASASSGSGGGPMACSPGMGVEAGSCGMGHYCNSATSACAACALVDRLHFGAPVLLGLVQSPGVTEMFPRVNGDTGDLFLVDQTMTPVTHTQVAEALSNKAGGWTAPAPFPTLAGTYQDTAPLYLHDASALAGLVDPSVATSGEPVLLFDSDRISLKRKVFALQLGGAAAAAGALSLPGGGAHESDIAVAFAASPPRFFWLSDAGPVGQAVRLVTALATDGSPTDVSITLDNGCSAPLATMPWVTPAGEWLLFASTRPDETQACAPPSTTAPTHLYATRLDATGMQAGKAEPVFDPADPNLDDSPSLFTPSLCALLFARFDANTGIGAVYAAQRD